MSPRDSRGGGVSSNLKKCNHEPSHKLWMCDKVVRFALRERVQQRIDEQITDALEFGN